VSGATELSSSIVGVALFGELVFGETANARLMAVTHGSNKAQLGNPSTGLTFRYPSTRPKELAQRVACLFRV
jgi:hypothetical protein